MLWYVRLRRAAKSRLYHTDLLKIERMAGPCSKISNPVAVVKQVRMDPRDIEEIKESRAHDTQSDEEFLESEESEEDFEDFYKRETAKYGAAKAKREFFSGIRFQLRVDSVQFILNSLQR